MARAGAAGSTAIEMDKGLDFTGLSQDSVANNYHKLLSKYENGKSVNVANKVYVMKNYELQDNFRRLLTDKFLSAPENIDFTNANEAAMSINNWVESKTNYKIKNMISPNTLSPDTRLALISSIHFKGVWKVKFSEERTTYKDFYVDETHSIKVPTMSSTHYPEYANLVTFDCDAVRLKYENSDLSMLIFLPKTRTGLGGLVEALKNVSLKTLKNQFRESYVQILMPKFEVEFDTDLKPILEKVSLFFI